jgi:RNA polymerase sigma-70 factor, ECF subfamily
VSLVRSAAESRQARSSFSGERPWRLPGKTAGAISALNRDLGFSMFDCFSVGLEALLVRSHDKYRYVTAAFVSSRLYARRESAKLVGPLARQHEPSRRSAVSASSENKVALHLVLAPSDAAGARRDELGALIVASAQGDRAAFRKLYIATSAKMLGVVYRIVRSRSDAEDVLQEVYLNVWKGARGFTPSSGSAFGWLASIARNRAIDFARARSSVGLGEPCPGDSGNEADAGYVESELIARSALVAALETLDRPAREMILLAYVEGLSREELSVRFASPVGTIKTWLHRGLEQLKVRLRQNA